MLNKKGERELAYVVTVDDLRPIDGADRVEAARIGGWNVMVRKGDFKVGQPAIYFEIDSQVPETAPFKFLEAKHYKIKSQRYFKGKFLSQGLLMSARDFGWLIGEDDTAGGTCKMFLVDDENNIHYPDGESRFLTKKLGVKHIETEENARRAKADPNAKYKVMGARHPELFKTPLFRWLMRRDWGKELLFAVYGRGKDGNKGFPTQFPYVHKTDEERVESIPWILNNKQKWVVTTKIDGTSATFIAEKIPRKFLWSRQKYEYYVCSRNLRVFDDSDGNIYWKISRKYHIQEILLIMLKANPGWQYVCIQGEIAGQGVQGNPHEFPDTRFFAFNVVDSVNGRWNSVDGKAFMKKFDVPWVPIVDTDYVLPDTMEELKAQADGECEAPDAHGLREGYVYRSLDGQQSFKNVSNQYLLNRQKSK